VNFLSLFSGIGGLDLGLERAGWLCVGQIERNPYCRRVLDRHWPGVPKEDDVTRSDFNYPGADAVVGGFPCINISDMGGRAGLAGADSGLWREMVRAVRVVMPSNVVVENVAALLKRGMGTVLGDLAGVGYDAEWDCLQANGFGLRQSRSRVVVLAYPDRGESPVARQRSILPAEVPASPLVGDQPEPNGMRIPHGATDRVDACKRIGACANAVAPQKAEWIGRAILAAERGAAC
jgi:DNA (cytosine-5)-methyltransferase 1